MVKKTIDYVNFNTKSDSELLSKLNTVARIEDRTVHNLARRILMNHLDQKIKELGISQDNNQHPSQAPQSKNNNETDAQAARDKNCA